MNTYNKDQDEIKNILAQNNKKIDDDYKNDITKSYYECEHIKKFIISMTKKQLKDTMDSNSSTCKTYNLDIDDCSAIRKYNFKHVCGLQNDELKLFFSSLNPNTINYGRIFINKLYHKKVPDLEIAIDAHGKIDVNLNM